MPVYDLSIALGIQSFPTPVDSCGDEEAGGGLCCTHRTSRALAPQNTFAGKVVNMLVLTLLHSESGSKSKEGSSVSETLLVAGHRGSALRAQYLHELYSWEQRQPRLLWPRVQAIDRWRMAKLHGTSPRLRLVGICVIELPDSGGVRLSCHPCPCAMLFSHV